MAFSLPVSGPITNPYSSSHPGIDFGVPVGTPIKAASDGVISNQGLMGDGGNTIIIQHAGGYESVYAHLSNFLLQPGTQVKKGQIIGFSGGVQGAPGAGNSTGPHLHFQIDKGRGAAGHIDPGPLLGITNIPGIVTKTIKDKVLGLLFPGYALSQLPGIGSLAKDIPGVGPAISTAQGTAKITGFLIDPNNLRRIGTGAIGVALVVIAGAKLLSDSEVGSTIKGVAAKAAL